MIFSVYWSTCVQAAGRDIKFRDQVFLAGLIYYGKGSLHMVFVEVAVGTCYRFPLPPGCFRYLSVLMETFKQCPWPYFGNWLN